MSNVLILGQGLVGTAIGDYLAANPNYSVQTLGKSQLDLRNINVLEKHLLNSKPDILILAAGVVGGIEKNIAEPYLLGTENSRIILNVIEMCTKLGIKKVINLVPACVYPSNLPRRMKPEDLWNGPMEATSLPYSTAKILGITLVNAARSQYKVNWISVVATNLYGDDSTIETHKAHVIPSLLMKFTAARKEGLSEITLLGDGSPIREFLHTDDFASAIEFILGMEIFSDSVINVSGGTSLSIKELSEVIKAVTKYEGQIRFANDGTNGAKVKLLDGSKILSFGWSPKISLQEGIAKVYGNFED